MPTLTDQAQREALLAQLASITTLERGTLNEEYRERPAPNGEGVVRLGPYYKHQCWEQGRNRSRRVPPAEVRRLREDLDNGLRFDEAASQLAEIAIAQGRAERSAAAAEASAPDAAAMESKKNSTKRRARNATEKAKPSSLKSPRGSRSKG